jgi:hypothetical protein
MIYIFLIVERKLRHVFPAHKKLQVHVKVLSKMKLFVSQSIAAVSAFSDCHRGWCTRVASNYVIKIRLRLIQRFQKFTFTKCKNKMSELSCQLLSKCSVCGL